jgi:hypothetical protein
MDLGSLELQIFVSLVVVLGAAFVALVCDYLKGNNEQLREHNIELRVRKDEQERQVILDPAGFLARYQAAVQPLLHATQLRAGQSMPADAVPNAGQETASRLDVLEQRIEAMRARSVPEPEFSAVPEVAAEAPDLRRRNRKGRAERNGRHGKQNVSDWVTPEMLAKVALRAAHVESAAAESQPEPATNFPSAVSEGVSAEAAPVPAAAEVRTAPEANAPTKPQTGSVVEISIPPSEIPTSEFEVSAEALQREIERVARLDTPVLASQPAPILRPLTVPTLRLEEELQRISEALPTPSEPRPAIHSALLEEVIQASVTKSNQDLAPSLRLTPQSVAEVVYEEQLGDGSLEPAEERSSVLSPAAGIPAEEQSDAVSIGSENDYQSQPELVLDGPETIPIDAFSQDVGPSNDDQNLAAVAHENEILTGISQSGAIPTVPAPEHEFQTVGTAGNEDLADLAVPVGSPWHASTVEIPDLAPAEVEPVAAEAPFIVELAESLVAERAASEEVAEPAFAVSDGWEASTVELPEFVSAEAEPVAAEALHLVEAAESLVAEHAVSEEAAEPAFVVSDGWVESAVELPEFVPAEAEPVAAEAPFYVQPVESLVVERAVSEEIAEPEFGVNAIWEASAVELPEFVSAEAEPVAAEAPLYDQSVESLVAEHAGSEESNEPEFLVSGEWDASAVELPPFEFVEAISEQGFKPSLPNQEQVVSELDAFVSGIASHAQWELPGQNASTTSGNSFGTFESSEPIGLNSVLLPGAEPVPEPPPIWLDSVEISAGPAILEPTEPSASIELEPENHAASLEASMILPKGMQGQECWLKLLENPNPMSGIVFVISLQLPEGAPLPAELYEVMPAVENLMESFVREEDFGCRVSESQWLFVYEQDPSGFNQRRSAMISEKLWDFQLRHLGLSSLRFKWGAVDVVDESLADAVNAARARMEQSRKTRKTAGYDVQSGRKVVNA